MKHFKSGILLNTVLFLLAVFIFKNARFLGGIASARDLIQLFSAISVILFIIALIKKFSPLWLVISILPAVIFAAVVIPELLR